MNADAYHDDHMPRNEGRLRRLWRLTKLSLRVVMADDALKILAALGAVATLVNLAAIFLLSLAFENRVDSAGLLIGVLVAGYPLMLLNVSINTAAAAAAAAALDDRHLSLREALAVPMRHFAQIALWSLIAVVVGTVIEQLVSRLPLGGSIVARITGLGWSIASIFAIPVLALEGASAPTALRRSAHIVKSRWGEAIGGTLVIGAWGVLAMVAILVVFGIAAAVAAAASLVALAVFIAAVGALAVLGVIAAQVIVRQTFVVVLYRYATSSGPLGPFGESDVARPFRLRRRGGGLA